MGRFLSPDPIGMAGGLNDYLYCDDPVNCTDPSGMLSGGPTLEEIVAALEGGGAAAGEVAGGASAGAIAAGGVVIGGLAYGANRYIGQPLADRLFPTGARCLSPDGKPMHPRKPKFTPNPPPEPTPAAGGSGI